MFPLQWIHAQVEVGPHSTSAVCDLGRRVANKFLDRDPAIWLMSTLTRHRKYHPIRQDMLPFWGSSFRFLHALSAKGHHRPKALHRYAVRSSSYTLNTVAPRAYMRTMRQAAAISSTSLIGSFSRC